MNPITIAQQLEIAEAAYQAGRSNAAEYRARIGALRNDVDYARQTLDRKAPEVAEAARAELARLDAMLDEADRSLKRRAPEVSAKIVPVPHAEQAIKARGA